MEVVDATQCELGSAEWTRSVEADLDKAQVKFKDLLLQEGRINLAVLKAEARMEKALQAHDALSKELKALNVQVMQSVNTSEGLLAHALSEDVDSVSLAERMNDYKASLDERANGIYKCATQTLESRRRVTYAEKKRSACKRQLVDLVGNRNEAESEMERIHRMLAEHEEINVDIDEVDAGDLVAIDFK